MKFIKLFILFSFIGPFLASCGGSDGGKGGDNTGSPYDITGAWEGVMSPGNYIGFEVENIDGGYYVTDASGLFYVVECNQHVDWRSGIIKEQVINNECPIYIEDEYKNSIQLQINFDSSADSHGSWKADTFCGFAPVKSGTFRAIHCVDYDNDGWNACDDCDENNANIHPDADEFCDGIDNDCDHKIDEALLYPDVDQDGYGDQNAVGLACPAPANYAPNRTDCNDANPSINPGQKEICRNGWTCSRLKTIRACWENSSACSNQVASWLLPIFPKD